MNLKNKSLKLVARTRDSLHATRACAIVLGLLAFGAAQAATIDVVVLKGDGSVAAGSPVTISNPSTGYTSSRTVNADGRARFQSVPTGPGYSIFVDGSEQATSIKLRSNESRAVSIRLIENITVTARRRIVTMNALDAEVSANFNLEELQAQPIEGRDLTRALARLPNVAPATGFFPEAPPISINGANGLFTQYLIDGLDNNENFLGGPKFPISTGFAANAAVLASSFSAEYGRSGNGVVNISSRSGSNDWTGELFYLVRPGPDVDSASSYPGRDLSGNEVKDGFRRDQYGVSLGGPIQRDRSFIFFNAEYSEDNKDNRLSSPELGVAETVPGNNRSLLTSIKLDHRFSDKWHSAVRVNSGRVEIERQGGGLDGGVTFPSAGSTQTRDSTLAAASLTFANDGFTSETRLGFSHFAWDYASPLQSSGPQVMVEAPSGLTAAILGHPGFSFDERERSFQLQQKITWLTDRHAFKLGLDAMRSDFELTGGGNPAGNYRVRLTAAEFAAVRSLERGAGLDVDDIPATAEVVDYAVELRPSRFGSRQDQFSLYVEDQLSLSQDLVVTAGLRWDYDSLTKAGSGSADLDNIAPRLALNYQASDTIALRAGAGIYFDRIPYTVLSDALQQNTRADAFTGQLEELAEQGLLPASFDPAAVTFDGNLSVNPACPGGYLNCPDSAQAADLRATSFSNERRILNPNGLDSPYTRQFSAGLQWQISDNWVGSADVLYHRGFHQLRVRDLNAPAPFDPNLANLTPATTATLRALPNDAERRALAESLGLIRSQAAADATRPVAAVAGGARQIVVSETGGESRYKALTLSLRRAVGEDSLGYLITYTLSELTNNTDDINFRAANSNRFTDEWGPSVNDRTHLISTVVYWFPTDALSITLAGLLESGQPINYIPDAGIFGTSDLNGDGAAFGDAYLGNSDRMPGSSRNSGRLPWAATVDLSLRFLPRLGAGRLEVSADIFNLFNRENLSGFANSATQSNQIQIGGQSFTQRNAGAPRQFQFGVRYLF